MGRGGLDFPCLDLRLRLRRVLEYFQALAGRAVYSRVLMKALLHDSIWERLPGSDPEVLKNDLCRFRLAIVLEPSADLHPAEVQGGVERSPAGPVVFPVSDGSVRRSNLGAAAVLADEEGVFARFWCSVSLADPPPGVAENLGRLLASRALRGLDPDRAFQWCFLADALSTVTLDDALRALGSHVADQISKAVLVDCQRRLTQQVFVPAQHESGTSQAHDRAKNATSALPTGSLPFLGARVLRAALLFDGEGCVRSQSVLCNDL